MAQADEWQRADDPGAGRSEGYPAFVRGVASWFGAWGMHSALFSWLLVVELGSSPERVGIGQLTTMLPTLLLVLFGGALADRTDVRRLLVLLHSAAALGPLVLAAVVLADALSFGALLGYAVWIGAMAAFVMPARDSLLSRVAGPSMLRAVAGMTIVQFSSQAVGTLAAGAAEWLGGAPMLALQATVLLVGAWLTTQVPDAPAPVRTRTREPWNELAAGLREVARTPRLRGCILMVLGVAFLFAGPFWVVVPLIVRDRFDGGALELALTMMMFPLGTILGSLWLRRRGGLERTATAALRGLAGGALAMGAMGLDLPYAALLGAVVFWGLSASLFINGTRTIFQEAAPPDQRGRVLSVYQLGFMTAAPPGSYASGWLAGSVGNGATMLLAATLMLVFLALLWRVASSADPGRPSER